MNILILSAIALLSQAEASQEGRVMVVPDSEFDLNASGDCEGNGRRLDVRRVMFLENRSLDVEGPNGTLRYAVQGEKLLIERVGDPAYGVAIRDIAYRISPRADIDIELKLALVEGRLMLYWRETYRHRFYRQGLYTIDGERIGLLCEGRGGIETSH